MLTLYSAATSNGLRATIIVEELGLPYDLRKVDLMKGEHRTPEFLALNPAGQVPVLVDSAGPDDSEVTLDQSGAIMMYLAEKEEKFLPTSTADYARFLPVYTSILTDGSMTLGALFTIMRMSEPHEPTRSLFSVRMGGFMKIYDEWLGARPYIAGDSLTIADFALFGVTYRMRQVTPELVAGRKHVDRWMDELADRPGVQRGIAAVA